MMFTQVRRAVFSYYAIQFSRRHPKRKNTAPVESAAREGERKGRVEKDRARVPAGH